MAFKHFLAVTALGGLLAGPAQAGLLGTTLAGSYRYPNAGTPSSVWIFTPPTFVVGAGVESIVGRVSIPQLWSVDFADGSLTLVMLHGGMIYAASQFNGLVFDVLAGESFGPVASVVASGGQATPAALVGGQLQVNMQGQSFDLGDTITVSFAAAAIPEPASFALFGLGLLGLAALRRPS